MMRGLRSCLGSSNRPGCGSDNYKSRYRCKADYFSSQGENGLDDECRMTKSESLTNDEARSVSFRHFFGFSASSFLLSFPAAQIEMRKKCRTIV